MSFPKGTYHSEEAKRKISEARKGRKPMLGKRHSEETKKKLSKLQKGNKYCVGRQLSEETKRKIGEASKGKHHSEEWKRKISEGNKGKIISEETREKMSEVAKTRKGKKNPFFGKRHSKETKRKMSEAKRGEKCYFWQGGKSFEPYTPDWTDDLRKSIRKRDNYVCQLCGIHQDELTGKFKKLDIHHIDYNKNNLNPNNLISLCCICHRKTNYNRDYWNSLILDLIKSCEKREGEE